MDWIHHGARGVLGLNERVAVDYADDGPVPIEWLQRSLRDQFEMTLAFERRGIGPHPFALDHGEGPAAVAQRVASQFSGQLAYPLYDIAALNDLFGPVEEPRRIAGFAYAMVPASPTKAIALPFRAGAEYAPGMRTDFYPIVDAPRGSLVVTALIEVRSVVESGTVLSTSVDLHDLHCNPSASGEPWCERADDSDCECVNFEGVDDQNSPVLACDCDDR